MARGTICRSCGQWHDPMMVRCPPVTKPVTKPADVTKPPRIRAAGDDPPRKYKGGRPKIYANGAERVAAFRARKKALTHV